MQKCRKLIRVSYRSLCFITKVGERYVPITAQIIPGMVMPLLVGMDFRDNHIECPTLQKQVNELNHPRIFFFKDKQAPTSRMSLKQVAPIHKDMDLPDHTQMTPECARLGHKVDRTVELRISRIIQECQVCKNKSRVFSHGHGNKYTTPFNTDVLVRKEVGIGDKYYTHLVTLKCLDTGFTVGKYINKYKYDSRYDMLNEVALKLWVYGEDGTGFGVP